MLIERVVSGTIVLAGAFALALFISLFTREGKPCSNRYYTTWTAWMIDWFFWIIVWFFQIALPLCLVAVSVMMHTGRVHMG
jgi:hypothetical protein